METVSSTPQERQVAVADFIERLVAEVEPLQRRYNESVWAASVTGEQSHVDESARLDARIRKIFARREGYEFLRASREAGGVPDRLLDRQLGVLLDQFRSQQIAPEMIDRMVALEKSLENRFNNFRAELRGQRVSDNRIRQILQQSDDTGERKSAWEASKQIGAEVAEDLIGLVRLRNQAARELGFTNYYSMMLSLDELDEAELFTLLDELERGTRPSFEAYKRDLDQRLGPRFRVGAEELQPWHYADPFFQEAPAAEVDLDPHFRDRSLVELTRRFFASVGIDVGDLLPRADLLERRGKSQHAFCLAVDRGMDIRVLCNLRPNEFWMSTLLHEFGHAAYEKYIDRTLPFVLRTPAHTLTTEASAMLFGRLSKNAAWLCRYAEVDPDEARRVSASAGRAIRDQLLVQTRWCLVMCHMERELYRDPGQDLACRWWDLVEELQRVRRPEGRDRPDWASKIHFSVAPVYYHNYVLGEVTASQLQEHLLREVLGDGDGSWERYVSSPEVGAHLRERLYRPGKSTDWRAAIRSATGQDLTPSAFARELAG